MSPAAFQHRNFYSELLLINKELVVYWSWWITLTHFLPPSLSG